ncbi:MAG: YibE/F family protein [Spirochaetota bacterium]|nr:YibE/F family protein [Spirochaetota bacterium]
MRKVTPIIFICVLLICSYPGKLLGINSHYHDERIYTRAEIIKIDKIPIEDTMIETRIHLRIMDGVYKGETKTAIFKGENDLPKGMHYQKGNILFIGISAKSHDSEVEYISLYDLDNTAGIIIMSIFLALTILIIGRLKGFFSLIALIVTVLLIFYIFIPLTLKGYPSLIVAVIISVISITITLPIIAGIRLKTLAAIIGASSGIVISTALALLFGWIMHLSGIVSNEMLTVFYASDIEIDLRSIALSSMIIAALGAIMDVCISISSSTAEIFNANPEISEKEAFRSVLTIGTDILGSMVNTLILAYVGSSLSLILLISMRLEPGMPLWMIFNYNPVLSELVKSAVGSIGMFLCVPITALISVRLYKKGEVNKYSP